MFQQMEKSIPKSYKRRVIRYSESFKQKLVNEIEEGLITIHESRIKYGIGGADTIHSWIKKMGKNHLLCKKVKIQTLEEMDQAKLLKQRIAELEKALAQTQMAYLKSESHLEVACQQMGVEVDVFKKKQTSKPSKSD
ncbi:transposase [Bacillus mycoides]|uniref:transposase n=1 Tax=Bacillus mycoides TaxID=1405 RepID=UPI003D64F270